MSRLRAKCPDCKTYTAVAIGPDDRQLATGGGDGWVSVRSLAEWSESASLHVGENTPPMKWHV